MQLNHFITQVDHNIVQPSKSRYLPIDNDQNADEEQQNFYRFHSTNTLSPR